MDVSGFTILNLACSYQCNGWEILFLRCGFSIYVGWLTAATILNIGYFCKANGFQEDQDKWAHIYLWFAFVFYNTVAYWTINPLYGLIFNWVLFGVRSRTFKEDNMALNARVQVLQIVYGIAWAGQLIYAIVVKTGGLSNSMETKETYGLFK